VTAPARGRCSADRVAAATPGCECRIVSLALQGGCKPCRNRGLLAGAIFFSSSRKKSLTLYL
ncbi:hypothetical protein, partial [Burkholderia sp. BC1]|uniref:hypothetical protein n=1 Tax=Burkholderia sp. BC1 TaxID=1095370 RepID=UPI0040449C3F